MSFITDLGIGKKIMGGFGLLGVLIIAVIAITALSIQSNAKINDRVFDLRLPTVLNTVKTVDGVNYSLAALRGWMILGKDQFKSQRQDAWRQIRTSEANMVEYSKNWTNPENVRRLQEIRESLNRFEAAQNEVETVSRTIDETPATKMLVQEAAPLAAIIIKNITAMIDIEAKQPATTARKNLLGIMADVRGSMGLGLANIRAYLLTGDKAFVNKFDSFWATNEQRFRDLSNATGIMTPAQRSAFNRLRAARIEFAPLPPKMFAIRGSDKWNTANFLLGTKAAPEAGKILGHLRAMEKNQQDLASGDVSNAKDAQTQLMSEISLLGIVSIALAMFAAFFITRMITGPVDQAVKGMRAIANGDLTQRFEVNSKDEMGRLVGDMNQMADNLTGIVNDVMGSSQAIAGGSQQIAEGNASLSQRTEEQASSLEETASSMEEMTGTVKQNADSASEAKQLADANRVRATNGAEVISKTVQAMSEINASSTKIADIIGTIDGIAFQTNLLALNAAVEAARAGEQGRGFAVVASEVRSLAQRSADAAKEIKGLIEDSVGKVQAGTKLVDESGKTLQEIIEGTQKVADIIAEIAAASQEQASGIDQVNTAITQMDNMTQDNAALVEEAAAASRSMADQTQIMQNVMTFFKVGGNAALGNTQSARLGSGGNGRAPAATNAGATSDRSHLNQLKRANAKPGSKDTSEWEQF